MTRGWFAVRPAGEADAPAIADLWSQASEWLRSHGSDQWQYPPDLNKIRTDIAAATAFVVVRNYVFDPDPPVATITVDQVADPEFWVASDTPSDALYVHRAIVRPDMRGHEIGSALLDWASLRAERARHSWVRLDAWRTNKALHAYYHREGFAHVRTVELPHRRSGALFQRRSTIQAFRGPTLHDVQYPRSDANGNPVEDWGRTNCS
ncbi:GNAT family N-acetyltransferase [Streptomyces mayteni]